MTKKQYDNYETLAAQHKYNGVTLNCVNCGKDTGGFMPVSTGKNSVIISTPERGNYDINKFQATDVLLLACEKCGEIKTFPHPQ